MHVYIYVGVYLDDQADSGPIVSDPTSGTECQILQLRGDLWVLPSGLSCGTWLVVFHAPPVCGCWVLAVVLEGRPTCIPRRLQAREDSGMLGGKSCRG